MNHIMLTVIVILLGGLVFYNLLPFVTSPTAQADIKRKIASLLLWWKVATRYGTELGGYVHDAGVAFFIGAKTAYHVTGTWADAAGAVANTVSSKASLGDNTATITYQIQGVPQNSNALKGFYLTSIDWWFEFETAAPTAMDALIHSVALSGDTAVLVVSSLAFSYDTGHDTAGERDNVDQHKMTLTLTTPIWIDNDVVIQAQMVIDGATNTVVYDHGIRVNGTLRL